MIVAPPPPDKSRCHIKKYSTEGTLHFRKKDESRHRRPHPWKLWMGRKCLQTRFPPSLFALMTCPATGSSTKLAAAGASVLAPMAVEPQVRICPRAFWFAGGFVCLIFFSFSHPPPPQSISEFGCASQFAPHLRGNGLILPVRLITILLGGVSNFVLKNKICKCE